MSNLGEQRGIRNRDLALLRARWLGGDPKEEVVERHAASTLPCSALVQAARSAGGFIAQEFGR